MKKEIIKEMLDKWKKESEREDKEIIFVMAEKFLNDVEEKEFIRCNSQLFFAGLMYLTYKKMNIAFSGQDVEEEFDIRQTDIFRTYKKIRDNLGIKLCKSPVQMGTKCIRNLTPYEYIKNKENQFDEKTIEIALDLSKNYDKDLKARSPVSIASACLYIGGLLSNKHITQREISGIMGVTEITIRSVYKFIIEDINLTDNYKEKYQNTYKEEEI
jgi:transcription initiation factor TFIIIB Brf1 subunit/transcription initiation factor TFIIB